jgi:sugar transferase EpsL
MDCAVASLCLVVLSPLIVAVAAGVRAALGSPVFFRQMRPGVNGAPFTMVKFRTMTDARDDNGEPLPDDKRLTGFGRFLRSSALDEIPELWNVVRGDMSLVGPRPLLMQYLDLYTPDQARRHAVRPGITGWAQINGRNESTWPERLAMDVWYVDNWSLMLDLRILLRTPVSVLRRSGISHPGHATMPRFEGAGGVASDDAGSTVR